MGSWESTYRGLFLTAEDVPGLEQAQATHGGGPDPGDGEYGRCGCISSGFNVWQRLQGAELVRHVDIRWLFPSAAAARRYHRLRMAANSEKMRLLPVAPGVGEGARAFAGSDPFGLGMKMRICVFTVGPVAAKVFTSGVDEVESGRIERRAAERIREALKAEPLPDERAGAVQHPLQAKAPGPFPERWPRGELEYEAKMSGKKLLPGTGVEGILEFDDSTKEMHERIGGGDEVMGQPFVYHFVKGSFAFIVKAEWDQAEKRFCIPQMIYLDDPYGQLRTSEGLTIWSPREDVEKALGPSDSPDSPREGWLYYRRGIAFAVPDGRVEAIELFPAVE